MGGAAHLGKPWFWKLSSQVHWSFETHHRAHLLFPNDQSECWVFPHTGGVPNAYSFSLFGVFCCFAYNTIMLVQGVGYGLWLLGSRLFFSDPEKINLFWFIKAEIIKWKVHLTCEPPVSILVGNTCSSGMGRKAFHWLQPQMLLHTAVAFAASSFAFNFLLLFIYLKKGVWAILLILRGHSLL